MDMNDRLCKALSDRCVAAVRGCTTAEAAARAVHKVLVERCAASGMKPEIEVGLYDPEQAKKFSGVQSDVPFWLVAWESGPHQWAIETSMDIVMATGKLVEPYYSFDLMFYPGEWEGDS